MSAEARYEVKIACEAPQLAEVHAWLGLHPEGFREVWPQRRVNSAYLDTPDLDCLEDHLDGIGERGKLRFRWYGDDHAHAQGALELKWRQNEIGWKRRQLIPASLDLTALSWTEILRQLEEHADPQFKIWLSSATQPVVITSYVREYLESADGHLRATLDRGLTAYDQLMSYAPNLVFPAPAGNEIIVELKVDVRWRSQLFPALSGAPLRASQNSKYVNGVLGSWAWL